MDRIAEFVAILCISVLATAAIAVGEPASAEVDVVQAGAAVQPWTAWAPVVARGTTAQAGGKTADGAD